MTRTHHDRESAERCTPACSIAPPAGHRVVGQQWHQAHRRGWDQTESHSDRDHRRNGERHAVDTGQRQGDPEEQRSQSHREAVASPADQGQQHCAADDPSDAPDGKQDPRPTHAHVEVIQGKVDELYLCHTVQHEERPEDRDATRRAGISARARRPPVSALL